jgi:hypothetical protein
VKNPNIVVQNVEDLNPEPIVEPVPNIEPVVTPEPTPVVEPVVIEVPAPEPLEPTPPTTPVVSPIVALLRSRKFIVGVIAIIFNFLVTQIPNLSLYQGELMLSITGIALSIIGGIAYEDGKKAAVNALPGQLGTTPEDIIKDLFGDFIDVIITRSDGSSQIVLKQDVTITPQ